MSITRRSFGGLMGASFGMVALRGFALSKDSNAYFTHGVASGDPLKDRGYTLDQSDSRRWVRSGPRRRVAGGSG